MYTKVKQELGILTLPRSLAPVNSLSCYFIMCFLCILMKEGRGMRKNIEKSLTQQLEELVASFRRQIAYVDPTTRPDIGKENDAIFELVRTYFQTRWNKLRLLEALRLLYRQQVDVAFVPDLSQTRHFQFLTSNGCGRYFLALYNPLRAERSKGAGRKIPPEGFALKDQGPMTCFICADAIPWRSRGVQLYYQFGINDRPYIAACNPFPILPYHVTIAFSTHESQDWATSEEFRIETKVRFIVEDLYRLAVELAPTFVLMLNGQGAGATLDHLHFHALEPVPSQPAFPLSVAAQRACPNRPLPDVLRFGGDNLYPLVAFRLCGANAVENTIKGALEWIKLVGEKATANILMLTEEGQVVVYFVPRHKDHSASKGMAGLVGGLEVLGQFVLSTAEEEKGVDEGRINYSTLNSILADVLPPHVEKLTI